MAIRFSRRFKIFPGLTLNISKRGFGVSAGVRGANISTNSAGQTSRSIGIPGTGLSSRSRMFKKKPESVTDSSLTIVEVELNEDLFNEVIQAVENGAPTSRVAFDQNVNLLIDIIGEDKFQKELREIWEDQNSNLGKWICGFLAPDPFQNNKLTVSLYLIRNDLSIAQVGHLSDEVGLIIYKELSQVMAVQGQVIPIVASIDLGPPGVEGLQVVAYVKSSKINF